MIWLRKVGHLQLGNLTSSGSQALCALPCLFPPPVCVTPPTHETLSHHIVLVIASNMRHKAPRIIVLPSKKSPCCTSTDLCRRQHKLAFSEEAGGQMTPGAPFRPQGATERALCAPAAHGRGAWLFFSSGVQLCALCSGTASYCTGQHWALGRVQECVSLPLPSVCSPKTEVRQHVKLCRPLKVVGLFQESSSNGHQLEMCH